MSRDLSRPIPLEGIRHHKIDGCCFALDESGSSYCGAPVVYKVLFEDRQSAACPEHAAVARHMGGVERMWSVTS